MSIILKATKSIVTADGTTFTDRKAALAHATKLAQLANLKTAAFDMKLFGDGVMEPMQLSVGDLPAFIADNAAVILTALTVKQARGPRKSKIAVAPTQG